MEKYTQEDTVAHRYETSRPWSVAGLSLTATVAVVLLSGGIAHLLEPFGQSGVVRQLKALTQKETSAIYGDKRLHGENGDDQRHVADLTHTIFHQQPLRGVGRSSHGPVNEPLSGGFLVASLPTQHSGAWDSRSSSSLTDRLAGARRHA